MKWMRKTGLVTGGTILAVVAGVFAGGAAIAAPTGHTSNPSRSGQVVTLPLKLHAIGHLRDGKAEYASPDASPVGLPPSAVEKVYSLTTSNSSGAGQIIAIVDAYLDKHALSDLNTFSKQYGLPQLATCTSLSQSGACFQQDFPQGTPDVGPEWDLEASLDMEWAHSMAPAAKIVLVETKNGGNSDMFAGVVYANTLNPNVVSMSWGTGEMKTEAATYDKDMAHAGTLYTASSGDSGHFSGYPAASPNVIAVGGTTLNGCLGTSCTNFTSETAWSGSSGGISADESLPSYQSSYSGPVFGAATITALTGGKRGIPDVSFEADPSTGVSVYDTTPDGGQSGWWAVGGTSVGAPSWAGLLAAGAAAHDTALQSDAAIYAGGYKTNLHDITSGSNGSSPCTTDCHAGKGYDLVTGLGSPRSYP